MYLLVLTTVSSKKIASKIAELLLKNRLAACISVSSPIESHYRWRDKKETSREVMLFIKTRSALYPKLEKFLQKHHPYDTPEILAIPIKRGLPKYLKWMAGELS